MRVGFLLDSDRIQGEGYYDYCEHCDACEGDVQQLYFLEISRDNGSILCAECLVKMKKLLNRFSPVQELEKTMLARL